MSTIERLAAFLSGAEKHPETGKWFHQYDDEALAQTPKRSYWWRKFVREMSAQAHAEYAELERRNAELVEALTNVCTVLREGSPAIVDTVWVPDGTAETLLDHCEAALAHSAQEKADAQ